MSNISGIIDFIPEPKPEVHARQVRMLWLVAAVSLSMAAIGYLIMITLIF
jgi:hypothetical protein